MNKHNSLFSQSKDNHLRDFCDNEAMGTTSSTKHWNACQRGKKSFVQCVFLFLTMVDKNTSNWTFQCYSRVWSLKFYSGSAVITHLYISSGSKFHCSWLVHVYCSNFATGEKFTQKISWSGKSLQSKQMVCWWEFCNVAVQCFSIDQ